MKPLIPRIHFQEKNTKTLNIMNLAQPARRVSPASATMAVAAESVQNDSDYAVQPAQESSEALNVAPAKATDAAKLVGDPRNHAPMESLNEPWRKGDNDITTSRLRETGIDFEAQAAVSRGIQMTCTRKYFPCCFDELDFISYGEAARYVVLKDHTMFVYTEETDPSPLYTLPFGHLKPVLEDREKPHKTSITISPEPNTNFANPNMDTVLLVDDNGKLVFQVTFDKTVAGNDAPGQFMAVVRNSNLAAKSKDGELYHKEVM